MKKKDEKILKEIFKEISKINYSDLKSRFTIEHEKKLKKDEEFSKDSSIEGRLERKDHIRNLDSEQLKSFKSVVKSIKDEETFTEQDIDRLNNFTSRIHYLLKSTSPNDKGMADHMNTVKHDASININGSSENAKLKIHIFFNDCVKSNSWSEFKSHSKIETSFFDNSFQWKLIYVFSNIKNCQNKTNYPLYYPAWQVIAEWCFDVKHLDYDGFCIYYRNIDFLDEPKLLHFSNYNYLLRCALRNNKKYQTLLESKNEKEKQNIIKELREDEVDDINLKEESSKSKNNMASNNKYYILSINQLSRIFSITRAGKEFDFTLFTSESSMSDSTISKDDILLVSVADKVYYQLKVINKTEDEIRFKKIFEIEKSIGYSIDEEGVFLEIAQQEHDDICQKLFSGFNAQNIEIDSNIDEENLKEIFADWLFKEGKYKRVYNGDKKILIEKLREYEEAYENDFGISIFDNTRHSLETIIKELEFNIIDESGQIGDLNKRTVGNGSVKAILGTNNYIKFLKQLLNKQKVSSENIKIYEEQINFDISSFQNACKSAGLIYSDKLVTRFVSSLLTKPFVILTGLSGSGKTKLAQAYVQWICQEESQYRIIPVGADWTNREPLLGYPNGLDETKYVSPDSGALNLILEAYTNKDLPYFLILDEMNLSHVERYFADFLSIMESQDSIKLYSGGERTDNNDIPIKKEIEWPENLFIIGTVNIDETTYMFSPKVLDRANVIEFRISEKDMKKFLNENNQLKMEKLFFDEEKENGGLGQSMSIDFMKKALDNNKNHGIDIIKLQDFFVELQEVGAEFGYRSAAEIELLLTKLNDSYDDNDKLDIAIMQKLLPKLHGSRKKLVKPLQKLASLCLEPKEEIKDNDKEKSYFELYLTDKEKSKNGEKWNIIHPISFEKIERMYKNLLENGFVSYAEA